MAVTAVLTACGAGADPSPDRAPSFADGASTDLAAEGESALDGLCDAVDAGSDPDQVRQGFEVAHGPIHAIAAALQDVDRPTTARLQQAKQRMEAALDQASPPADLAERARQLLDATAAALSRLDVPAPDCT
ncbi:MAG: hypothetical protein KY469_19850 [Actinobacteria bacterium]|nr:hypothetical protein [Actinomycetota bacterium]